VNEQESLAAAINEAVHLREHDPAWASAFRIERQRLEVQLPGSFIDVQHVGSTSVPGLVAKPVIDILAGVESMAAADALVAPICRIGYTTSAEFNATLSDRRWFMRWAHGHRTHHLHVVVHGSTAWHEHLQFRDALRTDPGLLARYRELKQQLALRHAGDREAYTQAKSSFVRAVLDAA
jgi:GrpB-like predicted nucleotidyltransferase (UPF0157 family)